MTKIVTAPRHLEWAADLGIHLPKKDRPILLASIEVGATYLLTGDYRHFGRFYGRPIRGVTILSPRDYLATAKD
ncbi:MAG: hypothetical protein HY329_21990 [Chloroflexi bacterium]|nr:hypothetical protein [Chloroflexota bacterium]